MAEKRSLAYTAGLVAAVLPAPERWTRAATDIARALVVVGDVLPSRAGEAPSKRPAFPNQGYRAGARTVASRTAQACHAHWPTARA
jgi:hypothetical protein